MNAIKFLGLMAVLTSFSATAANWEQVAVDGSKTKLIWDVSFVLIDRDSVIQMQDGTIKAWFKINNVKPEKLPDDIPRADESSDLYKSALALTHFACNDRSSATVERIYYDEHGKVVGSLSIQRQWVNVAPETIGEAMLKAACAGVTPN